MGRAAAKHHICEKHRAMKPICSDNDIPEPAGGAGHGRAHDRRASRSVARRSSPRSCASSSRRCCRAERPHQGLYDRRRGAAPRSALRPAAAIRSCGSRRRGCAARSSATTRGPGADDPVIIDLPRGSYVPTFRRRQTDAGVLQRWRLRSAGSVPDWTRYRARSLVLAAIAFVGLGARRGDAAAQRPRAAGRRAAGRVAPGNGMPVAGGGEPRRSPARPRLGAVSPASAVGKNSRRLFALRHDQYCDRSEDGHDPSHRLSTARLGRLSRRSDRDVPVPPVGYRRRQHRLVAGVRSRPRHQRKRSWSRRSSCA